MRVSGGSKVSGPLGGAQVEEDDCASPRAWGCDWLSPRACGGGWLVPRAFGGGLAPDRKFFGGTTAGAWPARG